MASTVQQLNFSKKKEKKEKKKKSSVQPAPGLAANTVGNAFVDQYYHILHQSPGLVHRFYQDNSKLGRPEANGVMSITTSMQAINDKILSLHYGDFSAEITTMDAQESYNGGLLVLVTGCLTGKNNVRQKFTQSFFLAPQERGYFVLNDVFRYVDETNYDGNQAPVIDVEAPIIPDREDSLVQGTRVSDQAAILSEEVIVEEMCDPTENGHGTIKAEEAPVPEVAEEVPDDIHMVVAESNSKIEEVPKKSYASIVMKDSAVSISSPPPSSLRSIRKSQEQQPPSALPPVQSVELTNKAVDFLTEIFELFDSDGDNTLRPVEVDDLFSTAPECPWHEAPYKHAAEVTALGGLSLDGFLSQWALMTLLDPASTVENLRYIGYPGDPSSAVCVTRRGHMDCKKQQSERNVFQCFVFGPKNAGKSALLNSFLGRPFNDNCLTTDERYAVHVVNQPGGTRKILVLQEIPDDGVGKLLSNKDSLAACDVAVFVHDSSDESSWIKATELLVDVAGHGEDTGYEVPCLIVAAKDDLDSFPSAIQDSIRVSQDMGIEAPIPISSKLGDFNNVFQRIIVAAEHPHLSIPETEAGRTWRQYHPLINRSLMFVSVGAAVAIVGLAAYHVYAARKNTSG